MNFKLISGKLINKSVINAINLNHKLAAFIPNGRYLTLDLKRSEEQVSTIFDVGANVGQTALYYQPAFPKAHIYCFEPVPGTFNQLAKNTRDYTLITPVNLALGTKKETLMILNQADTEINSLKNQTDNTGKGVVIHAETGRDYCTANQIAAIDLLKIDTEGYELEVLKGFGDEFLQHNVKFIYAETGFGRSDILKTNYADIADYLTPMGFLNGGFYEPFRWGRKKMLLGFCNVLFVNTHLVPQ